MRTLITCLVVALAGLTAPAAGAAPSATTAATTTAGPTTTVTLAVTGCNGCRVTPVWYPSASEPADYWVGPTRSVRRGIVRFTIARRHTFGLSFRIRDPRAVRDRGVPVIVMRYGQRRAGSPVSARAARNATIAYHCYAGTRRDRIRIPVTVDRFRGRDSRTGELGHLIRPYADPTARWWDFGYPVLIRRGVATTHDAGPCGR